MWQLSILTCCLVYSLWLALGHEKQLDLSRSIACVCLCVCMCICACGCVFLRVRMCAVTVYACTHVYVLGLGDSKILVLSRWLEKMSR